jgi:hypothetical protein
MRSFLAVLLALYLVFVARLTLADPSAGRFAFDLADRWAFRLSDGQLQWGETQQIANVALFVPIGFLLTLLVRRPLLVMALGFLGSVAIELAQLEFLPTRVADLADVEHNGLGAILGVLLAIPFLWLGRVQTPPARLEFA